MLKIGSYVDTWDNSGALQIQIINLRVKHTYKSSHISSGSRCLGVVKKDIVNTSNNFSISKKKSLKRKDLVEVLIVCTKKKISRKNGIFFNFSDNVCVPFEFKNKRNQPIATRLFVPILKKMEKKKIYKPVVLMAKKAL